MAENTWIIWTIGLWPHPRCSNRYHHLYRAPSCPGTPR